MKTICFKSRLLFIYSEFALRIDKFRGESKYLSPAFDDKKVST